MRRIAILGPESTGKSDLCKHLAKSYSSALWVPEFARNYLENNGPNYTFEDLDFIAQGQLDAIAKAEKFVPEYLFADTEMLVMQIWSSFVFNKVSDFIKRKVEEQKFDLYLLCDIDLAWEYDPLREHPEHRKELFDLYRKHLVLLNWPYRIVSGLGEERKENAIKIIEEFYNEPSK